jgi:hypothetical protein
MTGFRKASFILALVLAAGLSAFADSTYMGVQPGLSTRADAEAVFGSPVSTTDQRLFEYKIEGVSGKVLVEYRPDGVVERIERWFARPVTRSAMMRSLSLPDEPDEKGKTRDGRLIEYFGGIKTLALIYKGAEPATGVAAIGYYSMELYDKSLEKARNPTVQFDPNECRDVFTWAQAERDAAKRSKNVGRFQTILEIAILAQRGDCEKARRLAGDYKTRYR